MRSQFESAKALLDDSEAPIDDRTGARDIIRSLQQQLAELAVAPGELDEVALASLTRDVEESSYDVGPGL